MRALEKILAAASEDFLQHYESKKRSEADIRKKILEARGRLTQHIDRYLDEIETSLLKSLANYNESTVEEFTRIDDQIVEIQQRLEATLANLYGERTLKTVITYYANDSLAQWKEQVGQVEARIAELESRTVALTTDSSVVTEVLERLDHYLTLGYEGYCESGVYAKEFSKTRSVTSSRCAQTKVS